jgi:hypothetical protein
MRAVLPPPDLDTSCDGVFARFKALVAAAAARDATATHRLRIGFAGAPVDILVAGSALAERILPAFAHLAGAGIGSTRGAVAMEFVDCTACRTGWPGAPQGGERVSAGEGWRITWHGAGRYISEARENSLIVLDRATGAVVAGFRDGARLTYSERARPLQRMMSQVCASFGVQDVHAALVAVQGRGALVVGGSGRGKTTTALDCFLGGLTFLGDDSVAIADGPDDTYVGHSLYNSARVHPVQLARWPRLADAWHLPGPGDDKALLVPSEVDAAGVSSAAGIAAILIPAVTDGRFRAEPTSPRRAFAALSYESQTDRRFRMTRDEFLRLVNLTKRTPCFHCELASTPERTAAGIADLIEGLEA